MGQPNARQLALRDPAMAALMGVLPATFGFERGSRFNGEFSGGHDDDVGTDFGFDPSASYGADFGAAAAPAALAPNPNSPAGQAVLAQLWNQNLKKQAASQNRNRLIEPNKHSDIKVERYAFTLSQSLVLGTAAAINMTGQPDTTIRPQRVTMNAPTAMFATITEIKVANVSVTVGSGSEDAFNYNPLGVGMSLDMPTLSPANRATILGAYTGFVPPGFVAATTVTFSATFRGPASIVA